MTKPRERKSCARRNTAQTRTPTGNRLRRATRAQQQRGSAGRMRGRVIRRPIELGPNLSIQESLDIIQNYLAICELNVTESQEQHSELAQMPSHMSNPIRHPSPPPQYTPRENASWSGWPQNQIVPPIVDAALDLSHSPQTPPAVFDLAELGVTELTENCAIVNGLQFNIPADATVTITLTFNDSSSDSEEDDSDEDYS